MKNRLKTPLHVKLLIAILSWLIIFSLFSLISGNNIYQVILWILGICILIYNVVALIIIDQGINIKKIRFKPQCSGKGVFPNGKKCKGCQDCKGPTFINKNDYEFKKGEPWAI